MKALTWERSAISAAFKETLAAHGLKMPKLAMPVRVLVTGEPQTPAIDATLELIGRDKVVFTPESRPAGRTSLIDSAIMRAVFRRRSSVGRAAHS